MIPFYEAQDLCLKSGQQRNLEIERVSLKDSADRVIAENINAPLSIQPFDNAAMDGFAVRATDLANASEGKPITLVKAGLIAAGDQAPVGAVQSGTCLQIMTGAPVPAGADAIVPIELVQIEGDQVSFFSNSKKYDHIRFAGEDFKQEDVVLRTGQHLTITHLLPLATLGVDAVSVYKRPRGAYISTGQELVDDLTQSLAPGQIYNSNRPYAERFLKTLGAECVMSTTLADEVDSFINLLMELQGHDLDFIVSSGAVSAGTFDFVRAGLEEFGAEILYHRIKLKPGKPNLLARLPNGGLYFGLPGNPVATAVGLRFLVQSALRAMTGLAKESPQYAVAENSFSKKAGVHMFLKGQLSCRDDGQNKVSILDKQASFMVSPFTEMNVWVCVPDNIEKIKEGDIVEIYPL